MRVLRGTVPVDDQVHVIEHAGSVLSIACRDPREVDFWWLEDGSPPRPHSYVVVGTGHRVGASWAYVGTAPSWVMGGVLIWHLFEVKAAP